MTKVIQHLWFADDMEAAIRFYVATIPGSAIGAFHVPPIKTPSGGSVQIAEFTLGDQHYRAIEAGPLDPFNHSFSIVVECDDQAEIDRLWNALTDGGSIEQCGWLKDRWGLAWQIVPRFFGEVMGGSDREKAKRVGEAAMTMVKYDIAGLERAAEGADQ